jgi:hypothetical protein
MEEARRICVGRLSVDYPNFFSDAKSYVKSLEKAQPLTKNESDLQASVENFIISNIPPESLLSVKPILPLSTVPAQESGDEKRMRELKHTLAKGLYEAQLLQYEVEQEYALASKQMIIESAQEILGDSISNALKSFSGLKVSHIEPMRQTLIEWKIFQQKLNQIESRYDALEKEYNIFLTATRDNLKSKLQKTNLTEAQIDSILRDVGSDPHWVDDLHAQLERDRVSDARFKKAFSPPTSPDYSSPSPKMDGQLEPLRLEEKALDKQKGKPDHSKEKNKNKAQGI